MLRAWVEAALMKPVQKFKTTIKYRQLSNAAEAVSDTNARALTSYLPGEKGKSWN